MNKNRRRSFGFVMVAGSAMAAACSVDTSGITFVEDGRYNAITAGKADVGSGETGAGGEPDSGGEPNTGGATSTGGALNNGGKGGKAGSSNGGSTTTAGRAGSSSGGAGAGGTGGGGVAGAGGGNPGVCPLVKGDPMAVLIDDLDDGDPMLPMTGGRMGGWYVSNDGTMTGVQMPPPSMSKPPLPEMGGANGTKFAMHTNGYGFKLWGANVGLTLLNVPGRPPCPYDVSRYTGVKFWAKGSVGGGFLRVSLPTVETHVAAQGGTCDPAQGICGDHFGMDLQALDPTQYTQFKADFALLQQQYDPSMSTTFVRAHVLNVEFDVPKNAMFDVWIDDIEFY